MPVADFFQVPPSHKEINYINKHQPVQHASTYTFDTDEIVKCK